VLALVEKRILALVSDFDQAKQKLTATLKEKSYNKKLRL
jgi:hypothetical protein